MLPCTEKKLNYLGTRIAVIKLCISYMALCVPACEIFVQQCAEKMDHMGSMTIGAVPKELKLGLRIICKILSLCHSQIYESRRDVRSMTNIWKFSNINSLIRIQSHFNMTVMLAGENF